MNLRKIFLSILTFGLLATSINVVSTISNSKETGSIEEYGFDVTDRSNQGVNIKNALSSEGVEYSNTFVQYALGEDGNYYLRFATAVKGTNLSSISYTRSAITGADASVIAEKEITISTLYSGISANGVVKYYDGSNIVNEQSEATKDYYWACYTIKYISTNYHASDMTISFVVNGDLTDNSRTLSLNSVIKDAYEGNFLTYKVEGESLANYQEGNTNYVENYKNTFVTDSSDPNYISKQTSNAALKYEDVTAVETSNNRSLGGIIFNSEVNLHMYSDYDATVDFLLRACSVCRLNGSSKTVKDFYFATETTEYVEMYVNGKKINLSGKMIPGHTASSWAVKDYFCWGTISLGEVKFNQGDNLIKFKFVNTGNRGYKTSDGGAAFINIDYFAAVVKSIDANQTVCKTSAPSFNSYTNYTSVDSITYDSTKYVLNTGITVNESEITYTNANGETFDFTNACGKQTINASFGEFSQSYTVTILPERYVVEGESYQGSDYYDDKYYVESSSTMGVETSGNNTYLVKINNKNVYNFHVYSYGNDTFDFTIAAAVTCYKGSTIYSTQLNKLIKVQVNGEDYPISDSVILPGNTSKNWYNVFEHALGEVMLKEGDNIITITLIGDGSTIHSATGGTFNLDKIAFRKLSSLYIRGESSLAIDENGHAKNPFTVYANATDGTNSILVYDYKLRDENGTLIDDNYVFIDGFNQVVTASYDELQVMAFINTAGRYQLKAEAEVTDLVSFEDDLIQSVQISYSGLTTMTDTDTASGGGYLGNTAKGNKLTITIEANTAGTIDLYLGGSSVARTGKTTSTYKMVDVELVDIISVKHNESEIEVSPYVYFDGYNTQNWFNWDEEHICEVDLVEGSNTIVLTIIHDGAYVDMFGNTQTNTNPKPINIDYVSIHHN